jgi:hypothetical protein
MHLNLSETLKRHYCESLELFHYPGGMGQLGSREWRQDRDRLNVELLSLAKRLKSSGNLEFIFMVVYDDFLLVETAEALQSLNVPMVNYHVDMVFQWYRIIRTAPYFTLLAVAQQANSEQLRAYNPNIQWMPMAANPDYYREAGGRRNAYRHDVSFVGSFDPYRRAFLRECVKGGVTPVVYGRGWRAQDAVDYRFAWDIHKILHDLRYYGLPRWRAEGTAWITRAVTRKLSRDHQFEPLTGVELAGPCTEEGMPEIFRTSRINLGFSDTGWHGKHDIVHSGMRQCRLRDFEVPMAGGFYLAQEVPAHREYYKVGEEIETWSEPEELAEKLRFYSRHVEAAEKIRDAGAKRAMASHTWQHRFDRLFEKLGLQH